MRRRGSARRTPCPVDRTNVCLKRAACSPVPQPVPEPPPGKLRLTCATHVRTAQSNTMTSNMRVMGFGNPLLDISAVVEQDVLDKCAFPSRARPTTTRGRAHTVTHARTAAC